MIAAVATRRWIWVAIWQLWDRVSLYLPIVMMGFLGLGTYWLVRNTPVFDAPAAARVVLHEADYFMRNFTVKNFGENGKLTSQVSGIEARHYPDTDTLEIDAGRVRSIGPQGQITVSSADRVLSNGDGSELQLFGNAVVIREPIRDASGRETPRLTYRSDFLHAFVNEERVTSYKPVVLTRGTDEFTGDNFAYDSLSGVGELKGRVRGVLTPRASQRSFPSQPLAQPQSPPSSQPRPAP